MNTLSEATVYEQVAILAGIPVAELSDPGSLLARLPQVETAFHERLIGQPTAVQAIMASLKARLIRASSDRPMLNLLCVGPSGVGKTETAIQLARICMGSDEALVRIDMSEFNEPHSLARLIGSPPGYVGHGTGGQLTEAVRRRPRSAVLFDEIEKAAPEVLNALLQVMSAGRLTDSTGQTVDFRRAMLVMTSNLGNKAADRHPDPQDFERQTLEAVRSGLAPELLGRLDATVVFGHLDVESLEQIVLLRLNDMAASISGVSAFEPEADVVRKLAQEAWHPESGAREVDRVLRHRIDPAVVQMLERGDINQSQPSTVSIRLEGGYFLFGKVTGEQT